MPNRDYKFFCQAERGPDGKPAIRWAYKAAKEIAAFKNFSIWEMLAADKTDIAGEDRAPDGYLLPDSAAVWKPGKMRSTTMCLIRDAIEHGDCLVPLFVPVAPKVKVSVAPKV